MNHHTEIDSYLSYVKSVCPKITDEAIAYYRKGLSVERLHARDYYIKRGDVQTQSGYIVSGLVRVYYIDGKGNENNVTFIKEGEQVIHYGAVVRNQPSKYYFQCIEPTIIVNIPLEHTRICCNKYTEMEHYLRLLVEQELFRKQQRIDSFIFNTAEERYLSFIEENPSLFKRLTLSQLSSYLGIERQTLTRIRKRLLKP